MIMIDYIWRSIIRNAGRSIVFIATALSLICLLCTYLSNIWSNEQLLKTLSDRIPVTASFTNADGSRETGLSISPKLVEGLMESGVTQPIVTAESYGNIDREKMGQDGGFISVYMIGSNSIEAFAFDQEQMQIAESLDFLSGYDAKCILNYAFARERGLEVQVGEVLELNLFKAKYDEYGDSFEFSEVAPAQLTIVGLYEGEQFGTSEGDAPDIICPVSWLRRQYEAAQVFFEYSSAMCTLADPLLLNVFKSRATDLKLKQVDGLARFSRAGTALLVRDKVFIESASQIMRNIQMLRLFLVPVTLFLSVLVTLTSVFLTRNRRLEISIAKCLGVKRGAIASALVLENCTLAFLGGLLATLIMLPGTGINPSTYFLILLLFVLIEALGSLTSALILGHTNGMKLLSSVD